MGKKLALWGIGDRADIYMKFDYFSDYEIICFIDSYRYDSQFYGVQVQRPEYLKQIIDDIDYLIIATSHYSEIFYLCIQMQIPRDKIILTDIVQESVFQTNLEIIKELFPLLFQSMQINHYKLIKMNTTDFHEGKGLIGRGKYAKNEYMSDYFRFKTFELAAEEIKRAEVEGETAELGVFRGSFASLISDTFPDRKIYLFDTFEGFEPNEAKREAASGHSDEKFEYAHTRTSEQTALGNMPYPEQCILCKGYFPQSITQEARKTTFAFVSIDVDFEDSIYEGLKFFYDRLNEGGYLFIHDYNNPSLKGVKNAVDRYEQEKKAVLKKLPLADWAGTLVIIK